MSAKAAAMGGSPVNILVAEDDPNDVLFLRHAFEKAGVCATLHFVSDGREAIAYLKELIGPSTRTNNRMPDLLMLDLNMPAVGGLEVLSWLRAQPELAEMRVAVISSSLAPDACEQAARLGAYRCITKPMNPLEWVAIFQELHGGLPVLKQDLPGGNEPRA